MDPEDAAGAKDALAALREQQKRTGGFTGQGGGASPSREGGAGPWAAMRTQWEEKKSTGADLGGGGDRRWRAGIEVARDWRLFRAGVRVIQVASVW